MTSPRSPRDYARLHSDWFDDPVIVEAALVEPAARWIWPILIGMAKRSSHHEENPSGTIKMTPSSLAHKSGCTNEQIMGAIDALEEGDLLRCERRDKHIFVTLSMFDKWQVPKGSEADRQQAKRDRASRDFVPLSHGFVTPRHASSQVVTQTETETETDTEKKIKPSSSEKTIRTPRIKTTTPEQITAQIESCRETLGANSTLVDALVSQLAATNKSGTVSASRTLNELWRPLAAAADAGLTPSAIGHGLQAALSKGAPNANYVKLAASGYSKPPTTAAPILGRPTKARTFTDDYDAGTIHI